MFASETQLGSLFLILSSKLTLQFEVIHNLDKIDAVAVCFSDD